MSPRLAPDGASLPAIFATGYELPDAIPRRGYKVTLVAGALNGKRDVDADFYHFRSPLTLGTIRAYQW